MEFLRNDWYAAAWSDEIADRPLARRVLDRPLAIIRTESGALAAFDDCCPHRMAPLSLGTVEGETLRCGYHGLRFDRGGTCVEVPGQKAIPARATVRAYPAVERWNLVWLWMGPAEAADADRIPALTWLDSPDWAFSHGTITYGCNYVLLCDNLIDLSHTTFAHPQTIGTEDVAKTPIKTTAEDSRVLVEREMHDTEPSVLYRKAGGFTGKVDRWQRIEFTPPSCIVIDAGAVPAGTNDRARGIDTRIINMITPETPTSTFHFWAFARDFKLDDAAMTRMIYDQLVVTFNEDKVLIDGQQRNFDAHPDQPLLNNRADAGVVQARRIIERLLREEAVAAEAQ